MEKALAFFRCSSGNIDSTSFFEASLDEAMRPLPSRQERGPRTMIQNGRRIDAIRRTKKLSRPHFRTHRGQQQRCPDRKGCTTRFSNKEKQSILSEKKKAFSAFGLIEDGTVRFVSYSRLNYISVREPPVQDQEYSAL